MPKSRPALRATAPSALARRTIRCVVVGGVAIAAHGVSRGTQDTDFPVASADADTAIDLEDVRALLLRGTVDAAIVRRYLDRYGIERFREALGFDG